MSLSPINIFQRLPELKLWQNNHEELIKRLRNSSVNISVSASDYQTIEGLSAFDSTLNNENSAQDVDSKIISPAKSFSELLEEKLAEETNVVRKSNEIKEKKPFLRKGSGLQRFRMNINSTKSSSKPRNITPLRAPDFCIKPKATWQKINENEPIRKINELTLQNQNYSNNHNERQINHDNNNPQTSAEPSEQSLYERALEKELRIFEALEEKAENSSFSSTNSSVLRILSSTPSRQHREVIIEEKRVHWGDSQSDQSDIIESNLEKRDIKKILMNLQRLTEESKKIHNEPSHDENDDDTWSESSITSSDLEETVKKETRDVATTTTTTTTTTNEIACQECLNLKQQISDYEEQIKSLTQDKQRLYHIKKELEHKKDVLEREFNKRRKLLEDENRNLLAQLENEKKKTAKEKQIFQSYMKESQNRPSKKEREEISNLKQEVADLRETLKLKESKNGMTQARLRNQIKQYEKDNCNLKEEVEKLTRENAKLSASQKVHINRRPSETKILHEINKNITKLTEEALKKQNVIQSDSEKENDKKKNNESEKLNNESSYNKNNNNQRDKSVNEFDSLLEMTNFRNPEYVNVEKEYESVFRRECRQNQTIDESKRNDRVEKVAEDGSKEIKYSNGNLKTISPDGNFITMKYYNGDIKQTFLLDGVIKYFYCDKNIWQTTFPDGSEHIEFPDGSKEKRSKDGTLEITLPDGIVQKILPNGGQEVKYSDGSLLKIEPNGDKTLHLPNGQKEIETSEHKRREYPDGTVKILYPDGAQETRYANGRVRIKDANGRLISDNYA